MSVDFSCARRLRPLGEVMDISVSDGKILHLLSSFRFVPTSTIITQCFTEQSPSTAAPWVSRRLSKLRHEGLVDRMQVMGDGYVHFLTPQGAAFMGVEGNKDAGVKLSEYGHDLAVLQLYLALQEKQTLGLMTERKAREKIADQNTPYALKVARQNGKRGIAWPDLVSGSEEALIGYEVEWTKKYARRLIQLMHAYAYTPSYRMGIYFTTNYTHAHVSACANEANSSLNARGLGRPIAVRKLSDFIEDKYLP